MDIQAASGNASPIKPTRSPSSCTLICSIHQEAWFLKSAAGSVLKPSRWQVGARGATIVAMDISADSLTAARERIRSAGFSNVVFHQADVYSMPFAPESFDHVFACLVLEHLSRPREALAHLSRVLKPGGTVTVIEGDHGSAYFHPESPHARKAIQCLIDLQDRFATRKLADRLAEVLARNEFIDADRAFIESRPLFFLSTADAQGRPEC